MVDIHDDMAGAKPPFRVVACVAVYGRLPLLEHTIRRLYVKNGVDKVICSGDRPEDKKLCESLGAVWVHYKNDLLGPKWNAAFQKAKDYNPDACLFVGSSDWISDNWIPEMRPYIEKYDMVGKLGCHLLDIGPEVDRLVFWPGYNNNRKGETIGIGRLLSRRVLDKLQFTPFDQRLNNSLDFSMQFRCTLQAGSIQVASNPNIYSLSFSCYLWPKEEQNKHDFEMHWDGRLPSDKLELDPFIIRNFPEAKILCESLKGTSVKV